jgi:hypothetical protein
MKKTLLTFALIVLANHANSQVGAITKVIRGAEAASEAAKAANLAKAGSKVVAVEELTSAASKADKAKISDSNALIAARSAQIVSKCLSSSKTNNKSAECNDKSTNYQQCIATEMSRVGFYNFSVDRCANHHR